MHDDTPARSKAAKKDLARLSDELRGLMADAQRRQKVPKGLAQCPLCGVLVQPMKAKKVRTHHDPVQGERCPASGKPWAQFGKAAPVPVQDAPKAKGKRKAKRPSRPARKR